MEEFVEALSKLYYKSVVKITKEWHKVVVVCHCVQLVKWYPIHVECVYILLDFEALIIRLRCIGLDNSHGACRTVEYLSTFVSNLMGTLMGGLLLDDVFIFCI